MEQSKQTLKDFLDNLNKETTQTKEKDYSAYDDEYHDGYQTGEAEGRLQGLLDMYNLMKDLDQTQIKTLRDFARHSYKSGLEAK